MRRGTYLSAFLLLCPYLCFAQAQQVTPRPAPPGVKEVGVQRRMSTVSPIAVFPVEGTPDWQVLTDDSV